MTLLQHLIYSVPVQAQGRDWQLTRAAGVREQIADGGNRVAELHASGNRPIVYRRKSMRTV